VDYAVIVLLNVNLELAKDDRSRIFTDHDERVPDVDHDLLFVDYGLDSHDLSDDVLEGV